MAVMCAYASQDERGKLKGGKAGDQTGREVKCAAIYNFGQTRVYRAKDRNIALLIGAAAKGMADNNNIGYDQNQRTTLYTKLASNGWKVSSITTACECDCSEMAACAVNVAYGKALIKSSVYSGNIGAALKNTGYFTELTASKYLGKSEYIQCGDIIVKPGSHVIIAYTDGSKTSFNTVGSTIASVVYGNSIVKSGQKHAIEFTGVKITTDGLVGSETNAMKARVLQRALNKDYGSKLVEDGKFGTASKAALGKHYVAYKEKQYLVTAAEILMELNGISPNGVEYPGVYGNGLVKAVGDKFGNLGTKITADDFLKLL